MGYLSLQFEEDMHAHCVFLVTNSTFFSQIARKRISCQINDGLLLYYENSV